MVWLISVACPFGHPAKQHLFGTEEPSNQHSCNLFPHLLVTFWANWGNQAESVLGCPSTGRPMCPSRSLEADTSCTTAPHTPAGSAGSSAARGLSMSWGSSSCHRHPCQCQCQCRPPQTAHAAQTAGVQGLSHSYLCFVQNRN